MTDDPQEEPVAPAARPVRMTVARKAVVARLWRAAKRQLDAHEAHLDGLPAGAPASEADAKALATLARLVRELVALDASTGSRTTQETADDSSPAAARRHVDGLRRELAQRLERLAAAEADRAGEAPAGAGDG